MTYIDLNVIKKRLLDQYSQNNLEMFCYFFYAQEILFQLQKNLFLYLMTMFMTMYVASQVDKLSIKFKNSLKIYKISLCH